MVVSVACLVACLWGLSPACSAQEPKRAEPPKTLALLVGINRYQMRDGEETMRRLAGCKNDVDRVRAMLEQRFGFRPADIEQLVDEQATHANIVRTFHRHLIQKAGPDTLVVFWFSGHGSRVPDATGTDRSPRDEGDPTWNETLVAYDSRAVDPDGGFDLIDDELHALLRAVPARDVVVVTDCCHSGGVLRGDDDDLPPGVRFGELGSKPLDEERVAAFWPKELGPPVQPDRGLDDLAHVVHIAACESLYEAGETRHGGKDYGTMSWHLIRTLEEIDPGASWQQVVDAVRGRVACDARTDIAGQRVQCIGDSRRGVFGGIGRPVPPGFAVTHVGRGRFEIGAGVIHDVGEDSTFELVGYDGDVLGSARVTRAYMTRCKARWQGPQEPPSVAMRALLKEPGEAPHVLRISLAENVPKALFADCPWAEAVADGADYRVVETDGAFELQTAEGDFVRPLPNDRRRAQRELLAEHYWRSLWYAVRVPGKYPVSIAVEEVGPPEGYEIARAEIAWQGGRGGGREPVAVGVPAFVSQRQEEAEYAEAMRQGRPVRLSGATLKIIATNESRFDVHLAIVTVNEARDVHVASGSDGRNNVVRPGESYEKTVRIGCDPGWLVRHPDRPMLERVVVIATRRYADFRPFESSAPQYGGHRGDGDGLPPFLREVVGGGRTRGDEEAEWGIAFVDLPLVTPDKLRARKVR